MQVQESFRSVEDQEAELRKFAENAGVKLDKVYSDVGLSPAHGTCAGLIASLAAMHESWEAVFVTDLDHFTAGPNLRFNALDELKAKGRKVHVANAKTANVESNLRAGILLDSYVAPDGTFTANIFASAWRTSPEKASIG